MPRFRRFYSENLLYPKLYFRLSLPFCDFDGILHNLIGYSLVAKNTRFRNAARREPEEDELGSNTIPCEVSEVEKSGFAFLV